FPILSCIALDYLLVQGSSVPCEQAFLDAGLTNTKQHARLLPKNFGDIQTVKGKYKQEQRHRDTERADKEAVERR
ncbi:uncharacterized protein HD556DRAFT_1228619, partial [Suillus plorans]